MTRLKPKQANANANISSIFADVVDRRQGSVYDRIRLPRHATLPQTIALFQHPIGEGRSFADTNMYFAGEFHPPMDLIAQRFLFLFQPTVAEQDRNTFVANYRWELRVLEKIMQGQPVLRCAAISKPENLIPDFGKPRNGLEGEASALSNIGNHVCWDLEEFQIYIPPLVHFELTLYAEQTLTLANDFDMYVMIEGQRDYAVQ